MRLGAKQELFARLLPRLLEKAHELGWDIRIGEVLRFEQQARWNSEHCRECKQTRANRNHQTQKRPRRGKRHHLFKPIGILHSLHRQKLAIDLILCRDGKPRWNTSCYRQIGEWWEKQDDLCRWGGRFNDAGHFSLTHGGRR